MAKENLTYKPI